MNKKILLLLGVGAIVLAYVFNLSYAINDYGAVNSNLSIHVLAQDSSGSGSSSTSNPPNGKCTLESNCTYEIGISVGCCPPKIEWKKVKGVKVDCTTSNCPPNSSCYSTDIKACHGTGSGN